MSGASLRKGSCFMCGRYYIDTEGDMAEMMRILEEIGRRFGNTAEYASMRLGEIFPTYVVPAIAAGPSAEAEPWLMKWGFSMHGKKSQLINARSETVLEKPMFRKAALAQRCLIPATKYFEWDKHSSRHTKYAIGAEGASMLYMAGLFRQESSSSLPVFVILTRDASEEIAFIHDRMPVVLSRNAQIEWLSPKGDVLSILHEPAVPMAYQAIS